ncbi:hypothetical protein HYZ80_03955 [Candidatus Parcubacteria bacterium]|nr:hypothetical protein [Candidatus Parcubacteria bacterium]
MPPTDLAELDYVSEMIHPHLAFPHSTRAEEVALAKRIHQKSRGEILLLSPTAFDVPAVVAGLTAEHIETVMRLGALSQKRFLGTAFDVPENAARIEAITQALAEELKAGPGDVSRQLQRLRWYINDHRTLFSKESA